MNTASERKQSIQGAPGGGWEANDEGGDEVQGKQSPSQKHFPCWHAILERALRSTVCISSKFFTARSAVRLALVSFRTRAKRGIAPAGGGDQIARAAGARLWGTGECVDDP